MVKVEDGVLHGAGKKKKKKIGEAEKEGAKAMRIERRRAKYLKKFTLPLDADSEDVKPTYKDGVLTVTVAKKHLEETPKPKTVTIPVLESSSLLSHISLIKNQNAAFCGKQDMNNVHNSSNKSLTVVKSYISCRKFLKEI
ncbi:hypothetical protein H6P81_007398 [Aristolochia fimbriata]|uniref:SHSP domain-containing protein n=1 Tax=Aristolochia fimbriata TaxID=158543 RepID=A0AAV7F1E3_ARIFI|nr:hypothetical protein H6P81_007398 [Aristolochia fimbriata]